MSARSCYGVGKESGPVLRAAARCLWRLRVALDPSAAPRPSCVFDELSRAFAESSEREHRCFFFDACLAPRVCVDKSDAKPRAQRDVWSLQGAVLRENFAATLALAARSFNAARFDLRPRCDRAATEAAPANEQHFHRAGNVDERERCRSLRVRAAEENVRHAHEFARLAAK